MPIIPLGSAPTDRDLQLRQQLALLRQLEAQQAQEEMKAKLADPAEKARMEATARQFETRTGVGKFTPVDGEYTNTVDAAPSIALNEANFSALSSRQTPKLVKGITRLMGGRPRSNTAFTDSDAAMGMREKALNDPRVLATQIATQGDVDVARIEAGAKASNNMPSDYTVERANRTVASVDELANKVSPWTAGVGSLLAYLPATDARNFDAELNTLKSNIMMNELTQMREASKTGGALGQVSDTEGKLLQAALGALDSKQSPANLAAQLQKIRDSITKWQKAKGLAISAEPRSRGRRTAGGFLIEDVP